MRQLPVTSGLAGQFARFGALAVLGALLGCGGGKPAPPQTEDAVLNIYNWADYIGHDTIAEFERQTRIKVVYATFDSNQTLEAALLVGHSGYDIVSTEMSFFERQIAAGAYRPLDRSRLPNWKNLDPAVLELQARADPGNRYAVPYLHATNGFAYNVALVKARVPDAPTDSLAMIFDPKVMAKLADCGVTFLDSPEDVLQLALAYLHLDPNSRRTQDLDAAERLVMAVRPFIRTFDSQDYWHQLASGELCVAIAWSSDYLVAQQRAREDGTGVKLAFTMPREGSNITYNALLIPKSAPHPDAAHRFLNFILQPEVIAAITNDIRYGNDNLAATSYVKPELRNDPVIYPPPEVRARLYVPGNLGPDYDRLRTRAWTRIKTGQ
jgi:putrescine transport system substrate-binding protein